jgi:hypothetical protein
MYVETAAHIARMLAYAIRYCKFTAAIWALSAAGVHIYAYHERATHDSAARDLSAAGGRAVTAVMMDTPTAPAVTAAMVVRMTAADPGSFTL